MAYGENEGESVPPRRLIPHYHGDEARILFVVTALVLIFAQSTGADLPLSATMTVVSAVVLVIAAGVTNPNNPGIHWVNAFLAVLGTLFFGTNAVSQYRAGIELLAPAFLYVEILALLSLITLYFTTRTLRGFTQRGTM